MLVGIDSRLAASVRKMFESGFFQTCLRSKNINLEENIHSSASSIFGDLVFFLIISD